MLLGWIRYLLMKKADDLSTCLIPVLSLDPPKMVVNGSFLSLNDAANDVPYLPILKRIKTANRLLYYSQRLCHEMVLTFLTCVERFKPKQESQLLFKF
jgi:hypothetical protein